METGNLRFIYFQLGGLELELILDSQLFSVLPLSAVSTLSTVTIDLTGNAMRY